MINKTRIVQKPWGQEAIFAETTRYAGKLITIKAGETLSYQYHLHKEETVHVLAGTLSLEMEVSGIRQTLVLRQGDTIHITPGTKHRMFASTDDCLLVEVSSPELNDVVRLEDRYGRQGTTRP